MDRLIVERGGIDWNIVYAIAGERLQDFRAFAAAVVRRLEM